MPLTPAQVANQVTLQARRVVADYYDGWLQSDDELHTLRTRNVSLRVQVLASQRSRAAAGLMHWHSSF